MFTEQEIEELIKMEWQEKDRWHPSSEESEKLKNTIEILEADLKTVKGLKRFIDPGSG